MNVMPTSRLDRLELDLHLLAQLEVERAERLVEQQHARPVDQRARERDALPLAAGELARAGAPRSRSSRTIAQRLGDARRARSAGAPCAPRSPYADVVADGHVREQRVVLEDGVDVAVERRDAGDVLAVEQDRDPRSAARSRRSCAGSSSCRTPTGRASRRTRRRRSRGRSRHRLHVAEALDELLQPSSRHRGRGGRGGMRHRVDGHGLLVVSRRRPRRARRPLDRRFGRVRALCRPPRPGVKPISAARCLASCAFRKRGGCARRKPRRGL